MFEKNELDINNIRIYGYRQAEYDFALTKKETVFEYSYIAIFEHIPVYEFGILQW